MAEDKNKRPFPRQRGGRQGSSTSVYFNPGDTEQIKIIQDELGTSQSDAIRTAIRVYAAIIVQMKRMKQRN